MRKIATTVAALIVVLTTSPASARPGEPGDRSYAGPATAAHFAGHTASACVDTYTVYGERPCR